MEMAPIIFTEWFIKLLADNELGVREAARKIGISHPLVSDMQNGANPTEGTCVRIAIAFNLPADYVLALAGYRNMPDERGATIQRAQHLLETFKTERYRQIALKMLESLEEQETKELTQKKGTGPLHPVGTKP